MKNKVNNQLKQIASLGLLKYCYSKYLSHQKTILYYLLFPFFLIYYVVLIVRYKNIRFGKINISRIGHFIQNPALYCAEKELGYHSKYTDFFFYSPQKTVSNAPLFNIWKRTLNLNYLNYFIVKIDRLFNGNKNEIITTHIDSNGLFEKTSPPFQFNTVEISLANQQLKKLNIQNKQFVCLLVREAKYLESLYKNNTPSIDQYRNCSISNYIDGIHFLTKKNITVIRMGNHIQNTLTLNTKNYIEYEKEGDQTKLLDIYLPSKCRYFISCGSGIDALSGAIFKNESLHINYMCTGLQVWDSKSIIIFKKLWLKNKKRYMSLKEMLITKASCFVTSNDYAKMGIEVIENSPSEILDAIKEKEARIENSWIETKEDIELQNKFWTIYKKYKIAHNSETCHKNCELQHQQTFRAKIGTKFLKNNLWILDE